MGFRFALHLHAMASGSDVANDLTWRWGTVVVWSFLDTRHMWLFLTSEITNAYLYN